MPAKDNVVVRMTAEDAGAFEMWRRQAKGPELMGDAIEKVGHKSHSMSEEVGHELDHMAGKWVTVHAAIHEAIHLVKEYYEVLKEQREEEEGATRTIDSGSAKYAQKQRLKTPEAREHAARRIGEAGARAGVSPETAFAGATLLAESGVPDDQASGEALDELLKLQNATGGNADISKRVLDIIRRSMPGGKVTAKSIHDVGIATRQLTGQEGFNDQTIDLFAKVATDLTGKGGYDYGTALSLTTAVSSKYDPREAKSILKRFAAPGMQKGEKEYLDKARGMLGNNSGADYDQAADIQRQTLGSREQSEATKKVLNEYEPGMTSRQLAHDRLKNAMRYYYGVHPVTEALASTDLMLHEAYGIATGQSEEETLKSFIPKWSPGNRQRGWAPSDNEHFRKMMLGEEQIPLKVHVTTQFQGPDGLDIPHEPAAHGLSDHGGGMIHIRN
jgi:hypothetical protein